MTTPRILSQREPVEQGSAVPIATTWFRFLQDLLNWTGTAAATSAITVGASPYTYTASVYGSVIVTAGTVSDISFSRDGGTTFYSTGLSSGMFPLAPNDQLKVTWSVKPTEIFVPR